MMMMMFSEKNLLKPSLHDSMELLMFLVLLLDLGIYSKYLDDGEPSAALSPKYRHVPDSARTVRTPWSGRDES